VDPDLHEITYGRESSARRLPPDLFGRCSAGALRFPLSPQRASPRLSSLRAGVNWLEVGDLVALIDFAPEVPLAVCRERGLELEPTDGRQCSD